MPVKSTLVPDAVTAVPDLSTPETLPDASIESAVTPEPDPVTIFNSVVISTPTSPAASETQRVPSGVIVRKIRN